MKYVKLLLACGLFVTTLVLVYLIHVMFFTVNVVFYGAIADGVIATALALVLISVIPWFRCFSIFEKIQMALIWLLHRAR